MSLVDQKSRQPRQQKVRKIIKGEEPHKRAPRRALAENFYYPRSLCRGRHIQTRSRWHPHLPQGEPEQTDEPESNKERPPAIPPDEHRAKENSKRGTACDSRGDERIGSSSSRLRKVLRQNLAIGGECYRFAGSQNEPHDQQHLKTVHKTSRSRGKGPNKKAAGEHPVHIETVHQPAGNDLKARVGPEKRRKQNAPLPCIKMELELEHRHCKRETAAVNVIDKGRYTQQRCYGCQGCGRCQHTWRSSRTVSRKRHASVSLPLGADRNNAFGK